MPGSKLVKSDFSAEYDKSDLLKPHKLIVSFGERSVIQYNNKVNSEAYNWIFKEAKRVIRKTILLNSKETAKKLPLEELNRIRDVRGVSFIFNIPLGIDTIYKLNNISIDASIGMKSIDEIIVAQSLNKVYFLDTVQNVLYELGSEGIQNNLDFLISSLEKQTIVPCFYLNRIQPGLYSKNAIVPTKLDSKVLPVLSVEKELTVKDEIPESIADLFDDDTSSLSVIKNMDGTLVYTDREEQMVKLYTNGMLEYVNYDMQSDSGSTINVRNVIDISTEFVSNHFGFPENSYISDVIKSMKGDKYIVRYGYTYEGLPIVSGSGLNSGTIEVEIVGGEVKRYKRLVRKFGDELEYKQIIDSVEVLNILRDKKVEELSGEKIRKINDVYLAYYEIYSQGSITYVPVWAADVTVERISNGTVLNQRYIINAETGIILDK